MAFGKFGTLKACLDARTVEATDEIVRSYNGVVLSICTRFAKSLHTRYDYDDLCAVVTYKLLEIIGKFNYRDDISDEENVKLFASFIMISGSRLLITLLKKVEKEPAMQSIFVENDEEESVIPIPAENDTFGKAVVSEIIDNVPSVYRKYLRKKMNGYTDAQICAMYDIKPWNLARMMRENVHPVIVEFMNK